MAYITINGLYEYNPHLFDGFDVPDELDKDTAINDILFNTYDIEAYITDPEYLQNVITNWTEINLPKWQKAYDALASEFNIIENYDRIEDWTDTINNTSNGSASTIPNLTSTSTQSEKGFNSDSYKETNKNVVTNTGSQTSSNNSTNNGTNVHAGHIHGNIGVTTAPEMIQEYLDKIAYKSIYDEITKSFKETFCLLIY